MDILFVNNDHVIEIQGLRDADGTVVSGASARATLYEADGVTEVLGQVWPLPLNYTGGEGTYRGELSHAVTLSHGRRYKLEIVAEYVGKRFEVTRTVNAKTRYE